MAHLLRFSMFAICILIAFDTLAIECDSWLIHLSEEHHVSVIPKNGVSAANFKYFDIPNSPYRLAIPFKFEKDWKVETLALKYGSTFSVYNQAFGYSGEFDKAGKCINSTGFGHDQMERGAPQSLKGRTVNFNYDWNACEQVRKITEKNKQQLDGTNSEKVLSALRKSDPQGVAHLTKLAKTAGASKFYRPVPPDLFTFVNHCTLQSQYIDLTTKKESTTPSRPSKALR